MDLTQFEELEKRVLALVKKQNELRAENADLHKKLKDAEKHARTLTEDHQRLTAQQEELLGNQRDKDKEAVIRTKVADLLQKLEGL